MQCGKCGFSAIVDIDSNMYMCLVDAHIGTRNTECRIPTIKEKKVACRKGKIPKVFEKNRDVVRAALEIMTGNEAEEEVINMVKVLYGRND